MSYILLKEYSLETVLLLICQPSDRCLSAKLVPTFADIGCHVVSVMDPYGRVLGFLDRTRYFSFK
jgi:CBS-domain-containing membrane protein